MPVLNLPESPERGRTGTGQVGTLYVVATPIGNLGDITLRALETLKGADLIACEDTRRTRQLLSHYDIHVPTTSYFEHNKRVKGPWLIEQVRAGRRVALVCDAGTPGISDPGAALIQEAVAAGVPVEHVPGPAALVHALVLSGLPTDRFLFEGFLPVKSGARRRRLEELACLERTVVIYESPHRLLKTLQDLLDVVGDVPLACARELTKMFEEVRREPVSAAIAHFTAHPPRGEFVLVFCPARYRFHFDQGALAKGEPVPNE